MSYQRRGGRQQLQRAQEAAGVIGRRGDLGLCWPRRRRNPAASLRLCSVSGRGGGRGGYLLLPVLQAAPWQLHAPAGKTRC